MFSHCFTSKKKPKTLTKSLTDFIEVDEKERLKHHSFLDRALHDAHNVEKAMAMKMLDDLDGKKVVYLRMELIAAREGELHKILKHHSEELPEQFTSQRSCVSDEDLDAMKMIFLKSSNH
tara:strand:- start:964 stop:1323 length:360 start_codon:yes stop_codon:yes gene_type:complete